MGNSQDRNLKVLLVSFQLLLLHNTINHLNRFETGIARFALVYTDFILTYHHQHVLFYGDDDLHTMLSEPACVCVCLCDQSLNYFMYIRRVWLFANAWSPPQKALPFMHRVFTAKERSNPRRETQNAKNIMLKITGVNFFFLLVVASLQFSP